MERLCVKPHMQNVLPTVLNKYLYSRYLPGRYGPEYPKALCTSSAWHYVRSWPGVTANLHLGFCSYNETWTQLKGMIYSTSHLCTLSRYRKMFLVVGTGVRPHPKSFLKDSRLQGVSWVGRSRAEPL